MKTAIFAALIGASVLVSGCAQRAAAVPPLAISAGDYSYMECRDAKARLDETAARQARLSRRQNAAAFFDTAGVAILGVPLGTVFGGNVAGDLAVAKGEALALDRRVQAACAGQTVTAAAL